MAVSASQESEGPLSQIFSVKVQAARSAMARRKSVKSWWWWPRLCPCTADTADHATYDAADDDAMSSNTYDATDDGQRLWERSGVSSTNAANDTTLNATASSSARSNCAYASTDVGSKYADDANSCSSSRSYVLCTAFSGTEDRLSGAKEAQQAPTCYLP